MRPDGCHRKIKRDVIGFEKLFKLKRKFSHQTECVIVSYLLFFFLRTGYELDTFALEKVGLDPTPWCMLQQQC